MSPASYLTAPPRDAALIVAPSGCKDRRYDARNGASHLDFAAVSGRRDGRLDRLRGHARATCLARLQALLADDPGGDRRGARDSRGSRAARRCVRRRHGEVDCGARAPGAVAGRARRHSGRRGRGSLLAGRASGRGAAQMMRVAAIDLGTNATRLLVADVEDGEVTEVQRRTTITKLGEGVDARRRLLPVPVARVRNTLTDYRRELESLGAERTLAVATSAVRDAENGEAFLGEVEWGYGFATRLLTGDEEAAMTLRGVGPLEAGTGVIDVGGGPHPPVTQGLRSRTGTGPGRADHGLAALPCRAPSSPTAPPAYPPLL